MLARSGLVLACGLEIQANLWDKFTCSLQMDHDFQSIEKTVRLFKDVCKIDCKRRETANEKRKACY